MFFTLVATAASLIAGTAWAQSVGVALLGLALTWVVGAMKPIHLCWAISLAGLLLASGSVAWEYQSEGSAYSYWRDVYNLLPDTAKYAGHDLKTGEKEYWDEIQQRWLRLDQKSGISDNVDPCQALFERTNPCTPRSAPFRSS